MMQIKHLFAVLAFSAFHKLSVNRIWFWQICSIFKIVRTHSRLCPCLQIICFRYGCVFNCLLSIILCCWLEEQKILQQRKEKLNFLMLISFCMSSEQALHVGSSWDLMGVADTGGPLPWFSWISEPPRSLPLSCLGPIPKCTMGVFALNPLKMSHEFHTVMLPIPQN